MAKASVPTVAKTDAARERRWEVDDALSTMMRAGEIIKDKKLMAEVKVAAKEKAVEMTNVASRASALAKMGRISPKQMAKLGAR